MIAPVSSEFLAICQSQLQGLVQGLGASWTILYIPEEWLDASLTNLIPIAMYPEAAPELAGLLPRLVPGPDLAADRSSNPRAFRSEPGLVNPPDLASPLPTTLPTTWPEAWPETLPATQPSRSASPTANAPTANAPTTNSPTTNSPATNSQRLSASRLPAQALAPLGLPDSGTSSSPTRQLLQPLHYDQRLMGVLMVAREGEDWSDQDYAQMEQVATTLAAACGLEQRSQWWQSQLEQQELAQERQQDILDNLIHQFRNPLTALRTFGKLLLRRIQADDPNRGTAEAIIRESDRLQGLLQQIQATVEDLTLLDPVEGHGWPVPASSNATASPLLLPAAPPGLPQPPASHSALPPSNPLGREALSLSACELTAIAAPLLPSFEAIAQDQGQVLQTELIAPLAPVQGNPAALQEVLSNLLENALKYSPPDGTIALRISPPATDPDWQWLEVCDDGPGIPPGDLSHVFERHYRGVQAQGPKGGTGLGLAIVAALVQQMGGTIEVLSPAPWQPLGSRSDRPGTLFRVKLRWASLGK